MTRKLRLQHPIVFEPFTPIFLRRLLHLVILAPGVYFGILAYTIFSGVLQIIILICIAILTILLFLFTLDGIEGKIIIDAEGIEWRSPLKQTRLLWNEGLTFQVRETYAKGGTIRVYDVSSTNATITFGENLRNADYLRSLINAGINGIADHNSEVVVPPPPLDSDSRTQNVNSMFFVAVMSFFGAVLVGIVTFDDVRLLYYVPTVQIKDVAQHADTYKDIRVKGKLHTTPPVVARDEKHFYAYQFLRLNGSSDAEALLSTPGDITLTDGSEKLTVRTPGLSPNNFSEPLKTAFKKDWQKSEVGQLTNQGVDEYLKEYEKLLPNDDLQILVWNFEQDQPVEVLGRVKTKNNSLFLQASKESSNWMSPSPNKQLERSFLIKALMIAGFLALGIFLLTTAYLEFKKADFPNAA